MIYENGFYKPNGASDYEDSPVIAGMAVLFEYPTEHHIDMSIYVGEDGKYRRCPNAQYDVSRDQSVCLMAGLCKQGLTSLVSLDRVNGRDFMAPSIRGHEQRCKGNPASWFQNFWLKNIDLRWSAAFQPMDELNQLFCILEVAALSGKPELMQWYCKQNSQWRESLRKYWYVGYINEKGEREGNWRGEEAFCEHVIKHIEGRL